MKRNRLISGAAVLVVAVVGIVALLTAGGGSSAAGGTHSGGPTGPDPVIQASGEGADEIAEAAYPNGHDNDEISATGKKPIKPCLLVSRRQATEILGGKVKIAERLQGPTCVFTAAGREVSMIVETVPFKGLVEGARKSSRVSAAGHQGWCLQYETSSVVFNVGEGRVLQVTGPCQAGVRFAAVAIPRIPEWSTVATS